MKNKTLKALTVALSVLMTAPAMAGGIKLAHDSPPDAGKFAGYLWGQTFAAHLRGNGIEVEEFARGALGGEAERLDQVIQGLLEVSMSDVNSPGSLNKLAFGVYLPYLFETSAKLDTALDERGMLAAINEGTTPKGIRVLGFYHLGLPAGVFDTKHAVNTMADMSGLRLRALDEFQIKLFEAWGASGTIVSWPEVTNGLQTGVVDGYLNPPLMPLLFGQTEILKHFSDLRVAQSVRSVICSEDWYQSLSDAERAVVGDAVTMANAENRAWLAKREGILKALAGAGIEVTTPSAEALAEFRAAARTVYASGPVDADGVAAWVAAAE